MLAERVIVGLEAQIPYHSRKIFNGFLEFLKNYSPTKLIIIGDFLDCPAPARWNRATAEEFSTNLQAEVDLGVKMLREVRDVFNGPIGFHTGNHENRIQRYLEKEAPALADLRCLRISSLLDFDDLDISDLPVVSPVAPGWVTTHGDIAPSISRYSGGTAIGLARRLRRNVIMGHTHRLGHIQETDGSTTLHGIETGHFMDVRKASYVKHGVPNWQSGFVTLDVHGQKVHPQLVNISQKGVVSHGA